MFIHFRLGDIAKENFNPPIDYYLKALSLISSYDTVYLSTDDNNHPIIKQFVERYPAAQMLGYNEIQTIQFASTCKKRDFVARLVFGCYRISVI